MYKRKFAWLLVVVILLFSGTAYACNDYLDKSITEIVAPFNVTVIDVGEGDCILITLTNSKTVLIDCGKETEENYIKITATLQKFGVDKIDYFILTHPDLDHIGNAKRIITDYEIGTVFIPDIWDTTEFEFYSSVLKLIGDNNIKTETSVSYTSLGNGEFNMVFLTPHALNVETSSYYNFNINENRSASCINNLSPIIYLEYGGIRFLFTGDATKTQEEIIVAEYLSDTYSTIQSTSGINLNDIDVLNVANHGSGESSSSEFLDILRPKNAVISVGGRNVYSHPNTYTLNRLYACTDCIQVFATYQFGTINFAVSESGRLTVQTHFLGE